jgi:hypothetical protein
MVNFKVLKYYVFTCRLIQVTPSFDGLEKFKKFYVWESNKYGRG